jgi:ABC-type Fe3+ transport system substrate-binding protein
MTDVSRRDFVKMVTAAMAAGTLLEYSELLPKALGAKSKLPPATPLKTLIKKGQAEGGSLLFYVASSDLGDAMAAGFKAAYPWATLNTLIAPTGTIFTKVLTEVNAKSGADVYTVTPVQPYLYIRANACTPVNLVNAHYLGSAAIPSGYYYPYAENVQVLCSNPNLASYVPKDVYELAEPAFKGQFCIDKPSNLSTGALFLAAQRKVWGDKKWFGWLQGLQANNLMLTTSGAAAYQAVLIGQRGMCTDTIADVLSQPAGAPVKANFYKNAPPYRQTLMMSSYTSKPNMAQLFMNWAISPAGQKTIASTNRTPVIPVPGAATSEDALVPKQYPIAPNSQIEGFVYNPQPYVDIFNKYWPT